MSDDDIIVYFGPLRVPLVVGFDGKRLALVEKATGKFVGYISSNTLEITFVYPLSHNENTNQFVKASLRQSKNLSKWSTVMYNGNQKWEGNLEYIWITNDLHSVVSMQ